MDRLSIIPTFRNSTHSPLASPYHYCPSLTRSLNTRIHSLSLVAASMPPPQPPAAPSTLQHYIGRLPCSSSVLLLLAIRFVVALSLGYIHPDEFFQSPEVTASSIFDTHSFIPWEFADTSNPCRYHLSASTHLSTANQLTTQLTCPTMSMSMMMMLLLQEHRPSVRNERSAVSTVTNRTLSYRMVAR